MRVYKIYRIVSPSNTDKKYLRLFTGKRFCSYEEARQFIRQWIRKTYSEVSATNFNLRDHSLTIKVS